MPKGIFCQSTKSEDVSAFLNCFVPYKKRSTSTMPASRYPMRHIDMAETTTATEAVSQRCDVCAAEQGCTITSYLGGPHDYLWLSTTLQP